MPQGQGHHKTRVIATIYVLAHYPNLRELWLVWGAIVVRLGNIWQQINTKWSIYE